MITKNKKNSNMHNYNSDKIPLFEGHKEDYDDLALTAKQMAIRGELPVLFEHEKPGTICIDDIKGFSKRFRDDTGLSCIFHFYICDNCDRLHCLIIIDYPAGYYEEMDEDNEE